MKKFRTKFLLKELFRKSIHLCSALVPFLLDHFFVLTVCLLCCALVGYTISEILRLKGIEIPVVSTVTKIAARKRDEDRFVLGPVTLVIGILITAFCIQNPECRKIGIFALSFGDGLASLCGKFFGRIHISLTKGKTAAGSIACFTAVFISTFCVSGEAHISLIIAFAAMIIEILPLADMDNVLIPPAIGYLALYLYA